VLVGQTLQIGLHEETHLVSSSREATVRLRLHPIMRRASGVRNTSLTPNSLPLAPSPRALIRPPAERTIETALVAEAEQERHLGNADFRITRIFPGHLRTG